MLSCYSTRFEAVEVNSTFYALPSRSSLGAWRDTAKPGFEFACKASRYITHQKKLRDPGTTVPRFLEAVSILRPKLGPILLQLPPRWRVNHDRLSCFLETLSGDFRYVFEFRDRSWHDDRVYELLAKHQAASCILDLDGFLSPLRLTADFAYVRLHGPDGAYKGSYSARTLAQWAERLVSWYAEGRDVYCFFDNDENGFAPLNALRLRSLVENISSNLRK